METWAKWEKSYLGQAEWVLAGQKEKEGVEAQHESAVELRVAKELKKPGARKQRAVEGWEEEMKLHIAWNSLVELQEIESLYKKRIWPGLAVILGREAD